MVECGGKEGKAKTRECSCMNKITELRMILLIEIKSIM